MIKAMLALAGYRQLLVGGLILIGLYVLSGFNFLLFHSVAELFSVAVAWAVFMLAWNSRNFVNNDSLVFLGISFLFVGIIDLLHTLAYKGMGVFPPEMAANRATQLWIAARYLESFSLLVFAARIERPPKPVSALLLYSLVSALLISAILVWPIFPICFRDGVGLTPFKKISEYIICGLLGLSAYFLWSKRDRFDPAVLKLLLAAIGVTMASELSFTFYINVYGLAILAGHFLKIIAFFLVYLALIRSGITKPYAALLREKTASEAQYRDLLEAAPLSIMRFDAQGVVTYVNPFHLNVFGAGKHPASFFLGQKFFDLPGLSQAGVGDEIKKVLEGKPVHLPSVFFPKFSGGQSGFQKIYAIPILEHGQVTGGLLLREDISEQTRRKVDLARVLETTPDGFWLVDSQARILDANPAAAAMLGYTISELKSLRVHDLYPSEDRELIEDREKRLREEGRFSFQARHRRKDGSLVEVEVSVGHVTHSGGRAVCFIRDITERKRSEWEREITLELLRQLNSSESLQQLLPELTRLMRDWSGCQAVGIRLRQGEDFPYLETRGFPDEFVRSESSLCAVDSKGDSLHNSDGLPILECLCGAVIRGQVDAKLPFFTEAGSFWTNSSSELLDSLGGSDLTPHARNRCPAQGYESMALIPLRQGDEILGLLQFNDPRRDRFDAPQIAVFERLAANLALGLMQRLAAEALATSEQRMDLALQSASMGIWDWDVPTGRLTFDQRWLQMLGYTRDEIEPHFSSWERLVHPDDLPEVMAAIKEHLAGKTELFEKEYRLRHKTGDWVWVQNKGKMIERDEKGNPLRAYGTHLDITQHKQEEAERKALAEQLDKAKKMDALGTLASGIAHDFNNILAAIMGYSELAQRGLPPDHPLQRNVEQISKATIKAKDLIRQILAFGRKSEANPRSVSLNRVIQDAVGILERTLPKMIDLRLNLDEELAQITADPQQMEQIVLNLALNGADAMEGSGILTISTQNITAERWHCEACGQSFSGPYVQLSVQDTGSGMNQETKGKIFDPFFTTKEVGKGTGLGLSTVFGIVNSHNGHLRCETQLGAGTEFSIFFPQAEQLVDEEEEIGVAGEESLEGDETILVVDDELIIREIVKEILGKQGYQVLEAATGEQALEICRQNLGRIDGVILDLGMPGMGGKACLPLIRQLDPKAKVLIASGYVEYELNGELASLGAWGMVAKPYDHLELLTRLRSMLGRRSPRTAAA